MHVTYIPIQCKIHTYDTHIKYTTHAFNVNSKYTTYAFNLYTESEYTTSCNV